MKTTEALWLPQAGYWQALMQGTPFLSLTSNLRSKLDFKNFHVSVDVLNNEWWCVKLLILSLLTLT